MTILIVFILLLVAFFALIFKFYKTSMSLIALNCILIVSIGNGYLPALLLNHLQHPYLNMTLPEWKNKNAIILLGAGAIKLPNSEPVASVMAYPRIYEALRLYLACVKASSSCKVIVSGGDSLDTGKSEADVYKDMLLSLDIPESNVEAEPHSMNTYQNAKFTSELVKKMDYDQIVLVTSGIHLKRSLLYFSHFGLKPKAAIAEYLMPRLSLIPLAYNFVLTDFALHEYLGILRFDLYNFMGWNTAVTASGAA